MKASRTRVRVRYPETDRMGVVHHTHHLVWFEIGRTELLREMGLPYRALEERGVFMPVVELLARYREPARYDDEIDVETRIEKVTDKLVLFAYRITRCADGKLVATGSTKHASVGRDQQLAALPDDLKRLLAARAGPSEGAS